MFRLPLVILRLEGEGKAEKEPEKNHKVVYTDRDGSSEDPEPAHGGQHIPPSPPLELLSTYHVGG